jgi:hypothetical protein
MREPRTSNLPRGLAGTAIAGDRGQRATEARDPRDIEKEDGDMVDAGMFIGWNRPVIGREAAAVELFGMMTGYLDRMKGKGSIESYEPVLMAVHGGDLNGFFMVKGEHDKLNKLRESDEFLELITRASFLLTNVGVVPLYVGQGINKVMGLYKKNI